VNVRLVTDIPNELIAGKVEHAMQRERQLDDPEVGREMAAIGGASSNEQISDLTCQDVDFVAPQALDVCRRVDSLNYHCNVIRSYAPRSLSGLGT